MLGSSGSFLWKVGLKMDLKPGMVTKSREGFWDGRMTGSEDENKTHSSLNQKSSLAEVECYIGQ